LLALLAPVHARAAVTADAKAHTGTATVTVNVGEPVRLYAKDSTGGSGSNFLSLRDFEWDFDAADGVNYGDSISAFTYHKYISVGSYTVTLRITDDQGATGTDTVVVTVQEIPAGDSFYVTKAGSDSNGCTNNAADACLTITGALGKAAVGAGDTVIVGAGSYNETITFAKGGTANNPITVKAATGATPELYSTANAYMINFNGYDYITIDGLEIDGRSAADAVLVPNNSLHISILNCEIHHIDSTNLGSPKAYHGLTLNPSRVSPHTSAVALWAYIYNTRIHHNSPGNVNISSWGNVLEGVFATDPGPVADPDNDNFTVSSAGHGNYFKGGSNGRTVAAQDTHDDGWELYGASGVTIDGMMIYNAEAELIMCDDAVRHDTDMCNNMVFVNNIVYRAYPFDQQQMKLRCAPNLKVFNNTFYGRLDPVVLDTCTYDVDGDQMTYGQVSNNIFQGTGSGCSNQYGSFSVTKTNNHYYSCAVASGETGYLTSNPAMTDPDTDGTGDFSLTAVSPGIDQGADTGYQMDYADTVRPQGAAYDIGAYELTQGGTVSGTITADNMTESTLVSGGATIDITLVNDTLEASIDAYRQEFIDSCVSELTTDHGWNAEIVADEAVTAITRVSDTLLRWTLSANAAYAISQNDGNVTCYIPHEMLVTATADVVPVPSFFISNETPVSLSPQTGLIHSASGKAGRYSATGQLILGGE